MIMDTAELLGLGTAAIGRPLYINIKNDNDSSDFSLKEFRERGLALLESAPTKRPRGNNPRGLTICVMNDAFYSISYLMYLG